jgi:enterobacterial common antigen flippase
MNDELHDKVAVNPDVSAETVANPAAGANSTYRQIFKATALIGGSSLVNIGLSIVRGKAMAVFLDPSGFGLFGLYGTICDLVVSIAGMGVNSSGVRQIAEASHSGNPKRIAQVITVLRRTALLQGVGGAALLILFSKQASNLTFGNDSHAGAIALLALAVFARLVAAGQGALLQGMQKIGDLARISAIGAFLSTAVSIPIVYFLREDGITISLLCIAFLSIGTSWWYSRKVQTPPTDMTSSEIWHELAGLLKLGLAFMASGFLAIGASYAVRTIVVREVGLEAAGLYSSAWTISGLYVGYILQAMGTDFYPRLVRAAGDNPRCNQLVNEQTQVSLLLAGPGILATLALAPLVIVLFYSAKFAEAAIVLRWLCLGMALRVMTWPLGYIIVAKNRQLIFLSVDLLWSILNVGLTWLCVHRFGIEGAGMAFFASYIFHGLLVYILACSLSDFSYPVYNLKTGLSYIASIAIVFCTSYFLPALWAAIVGVPIAIASGVYSLWRLSEFLIDHQTSPRVQSLLRRLREIPHWGRRT